MNGTILPKIWVSCCRFCRLNAWEIRYYYTLFIGQKVDGIHNRQCSKHKRKKFTANTHLFRRDSLQSSGPHRYITHKHETHSIFLPAILNIQYSIHTQREKTLCEKWTRALFIQNIADLCIFFIFMWYPSKQERN